MAGCGSILPTLVTTTLRPAPESPPRSPVAPGLVLLLTLLPLAARAPILLQVVPVPLLVGRPIALAALTRLAALRELSVLADLLLASLPDIAGLSALVVQAGAAGLHRGPGAVVVFLPAVIRLLVDVAIGTGIDVAALALDDAGVVATAGMNARTLRAGAGGEPADDTIGVAAACRVDRLVGSADDARAPALVGIPVLGRAAGDPVARVAETAVGRAPVGAPDGAAMGIASRRRIVGRP